MPAFQITAPTLPGAVFFSREATLTHVHERIAYERIVAAHALDRDEAALTVDLQELGYDRAEVKRHLENPGARDRAGFM